MPVKELLPARKETIWGIRSFPVKITEYGIAIKIVDSVIKG